MKVAKNIKTILCDDVRQEIGGKMSLMGLYSKDIVLDKVPAILPFINLVIMLEGLKFAFEKIYVTIITPKAEPLKISYPAPPDIEKNLEKVKDINLIIGLSPFKLEGTGKAKFEIRFAEDEKASIVHHFSIKTK